MQKTIIIVGLGLIGGSLALSLKKNEQIKIIGIDENNDYRNIAIEKGFADETYKALNESTAEADVIIFATPVETTCKLLLQLSKMPLKDNVIISDVGSTKQLIMETVQSLPTIYGHFIGGHPMAGSHKSGIVAAKERLFENAYYILTPSKNVRVEYVDELKSLLSSTKAKIMEMTAKEHDEFTGIVSHFPHLIASSLVYMLQNQGDKNGICKVLAAGGFRDITRIASSNSSMWRDIVVHNSINLQSLLDDWIVQMHDLKDVISTGSKDELQHFFQYAKEIRDDLPKKQKGAIPAFFDLYVDVPDHPGSIASVATIIAKEEISIVNIEILEVREDIFGALRIRFQTEEDRENGKTAIENEGYNAYTK